jgi:hypothetical protein
MPDISSYDRWHLNGFNTSQVIVIHDGPDALGRTYVDGRHQHVIADYETTEEARAACDRHNVRNADIHRAREDDEFLHEASCMGRHLYD